MIENIQRENLNPIEEAEAYELLFNSKFACEDLVANSGLFSQSLFITFFGRNLSGALKYRQNVIIPQK